MIQHLGDVLDLGEPLLMPQVRSATPRGAEGVEPATTDAQHSATHLHRIGILLLVNEPVSQLDSFAKRAVASLRFPAPCASLDSPRAGDATPPAPRCACRCPGTRITALRLGLLDPAPQQAAVDASKLVAASVCQSPCYRTSQPDGVLHELLRVLLTSLHLSPQPGAFSLNRSVCCH
jgi:hypothetical protein